MKPSGVRHDRMRFVPPDAEVDGKSLSELLDRTGSTCLQKLLGGSLPVVPVKKLYLEA